MVEKNQASLGRQGAAALAEGILGEVARGLYAKGFRKFVVAGGETSGQVVNALGIARVEVSVFDELGEAIAIKWHQSRCRWCSKQERWDRLISFSGP